MTTTITGDDFEQTLFPVSALGTTPAHTLVGAASDAAALSDYVDTTYLRVTKPGTFRYRTGAGFLPAGARVVNVRAFVGATPEGTAPVTLRVGVGDFATGSYRDNGGSVSYGLDYTYKYLPPRTLSTAGVEYTAADLAKGLVLTISAATVPTAYHLEIADVTYNIDAAPTAQVTGPLQATTSRPVVNWDYTDDRQPQSAYRLLLTNTATGAVYDSGKVASAATRHVVTRSLPNGTYNAALTVYQAWPGREFPSLTPATAVLTISAPTTAPPSLSAELRSDHAQLTVRPALNLLNAEQSTAEVDSAARTLTNAALTRDTPAKSGAYAYEVASVGAGAVSVLFRPLVTVTPGVAYTAAANARQASALASRTANVSLSFYDATGAIVGMPFTGASVAVLATGWTRATVSATAPVGAVSAALTLGYSTATGAGETTLWDELGLWIAPTDGSTPAWTAGGAYDSTPNLLPYATSTMDDLTVWSPVGNTVLSSVTLTPSFHGDTAMSMKASSASPTIGAAITDGGLVVSGSTRNYFSTSGGTVWFGAHFMSGTASTRVANVYLWELDGSGNTTSTVATGAETAAGTWARVGGSKTLAASTVAVSVTVEIAAATGNLTTTETHRVDGVYLQPAAVDLGFTQGYQDADALPTYVIEFSDDNTTWTPLATKTMDQTETSWSVADYTVRNRTLRLYRASYTQTLRGAVLATDPSPVAFVRPAFSGVWLYSTADPAGTMHQFRFDGGGRTRALGAVPALTQLENLAHPFAEFGSARTSTVAVSLTLADDDDVTALESFAALDGPVVFRDQRGRLLEGVMGEVSFTDQVWGQTASFTLTEAGS